MAIELESRSGEVRRIAGAVLFATLRVAGHTIRLITFSVLMLCAPFIRVGLAIAALGGFFVILLAHARPHRHPFPYGMITMFSVVAAVLRVLFDRLLIALAPDGTAPTP